MPLTLLGQNVNSYNADMTCPELISSVAQIPGDFIIRFMTSHPKDTSDELISVMKKYSPKIAPFFHLPLQSGSSEVLRKMNRTYDRERYLDIARRLKENIPGIALSTDIIIGFPGESEADFRDTMDILRTVKFDNVYAFLFSPREGTRAARMENSVPRAEMDRRMAELLAFQDKLSLELNTRYEESIERVLVDSYDEKDNMFSGRTLTNKLVYFSANENCLGEFINVKITKACPYHLLGEAEK